jgi:hypothetical protein
MFLSQTSITLENYILVKKMALLLKSSINEYLIVTPWCSGEFKNILFLSGPETPEIYFSKIMAMYKQY